jgi:hypothetical protein
MWKLKNKLVIYGKKPLEINNKLTVTAFGILWYILRFNRLIPILMLKLDCMQIHFVLKFAI